MTSIDRTYKQMEEKSWLLLTYAARFILRDYSGATDDICNIVNMFARRDNTYFAVDQIKDSLFSFRSLVNSNPRNMLLDVYEHCYNFFPEELVDDVIPEEMRIRFRNLYAELSSTLSEWLANHKVDETKSNYKIEILHAVLPIMNKYRGDEN